MLDIVFAGLRTPRPGGLRLLISMCPPSPPQLSSSAQQGLRGRMPSAMRPVSPGPAGSGDLYFNKYHDPRKQVKGLGAFAMQFIVDFLTSGFSAGILWFRTQASRPHYTAICIVVGG